MESSTASTSLRGFVGQWWTRMRGLARRLTPLKWHYIYFLLAAFDLLTVSAGLYLNHQIIRTYTRSVEINRVWDERIAAYSHLGQLAAAVNAPGNDVFDNHLVDEESRKMRAALEVFDQKLTAHRKELQTGLEPAVVAPLLRHLDATGVAMKQMADEAELIFTYFRDARPDLAGQRMATMDRKYAKLNTTLLRLREQVTEIQKQNFDRQLAAAAGLQKYEYMIGALILFMVGGATLYGHRIARQVQSDAEERQHHLEALGEAEARTRCILDTAADGIITFDENGRIESLNQAADCQLGYAAGEAIGQDIRPVIEASAELLEGHRVEDSRASSASPASRVESTAKRRDGTTFAVELSVSEVRIGPKTIFTAIVRDVADRRKAEEAVRMATAAQAANRAKSAFLAAMSHELRTPLNGVIGAVELILGTDLGDNQREYLQIARTSADALLQVINDVLYFSRAESGKLHFEDVDFNLRHSLDDALTTLSVRAAEKGLALSCCVAPEVPEMLVGDPGRLGQVVRNLLGNAIKFTEHGQVALSVNAQHSASQEVNLHFAISDTGIGISPEHRAHIFAPFEQGDGSITRKYGGAGLGLAISAQLVDIMGGVIWVESEVGKGSTFHFTARLGVSTGPSVEMPKRLSQFKGLRVLIVDDDDGSRHSLQHTLRQWGMVPSGASNGRAAVSALESAAANGAGPFHLLLIDCKVHAGLALAEYVKGTVDSTLPIILMVEAAMESRGCGNACPRPRLSRCADCSDRNQCRQLEITHKLIKPIRQSDLLDSIVSVLGTVVLPNETPVLSEESGQNSPQLRVLVAEDNLINQKIAVRALEKWGHGVDVANNGREALVKFAQQPFDLILMDLQMPELDGFETTRAIREREQASGRRVPIIAVTAHAMQGDSERCFQAGMDSYVSKPLQLQELFEEIQAVTAMCSPAAQKKTCLNTGQTTGNGFFDMAGLDLVNTSGELAGFSAEVMDVFLSDTPQQLKKLATAVQNQDATTIQRVAHYLRGSALYIGAQTMAQLCRQVETLASQDLSQAAEAVAALQAEASRACATLECRRQLS